MTDQLAYICGIGCPILFSILFLSVDMTLTYIKSHYRWKLYYKLYTSDYPQTQYFRTYLGAKCYYRRWKKECKWIYINRLKGEEHGNN